MQYEEYTIDFGHPNIIEMSVPFETESVKEKDVDVNKIMHKLNMTYKQKQAINLIMGGMNPYQVSKHLKVSDVAIYERVKQVRKKYIKMFGLPYESYIY